MQRIILQSFVLWVNEVRGADIPVETVDIFLQQLREEMPAASYAEFLAGLANPVSVESLAVLEMRRYREESQ